MCNHVLLLLTTGISLSFWQVHVPYTKSHCHVFRVVQWAAQIRFHSNIFPQPPVYIQVFIYFTLLLSASLSLSSILSFTSVLYPPNFSMGSTSS